MPYLDAPTARDSSARESVSARTVGRLSLGERAGLYDHACWAYTSEADRSAIATWWLADGLRSGQAALYVADATVEQLTDEVADIPHVHTAIGSGALRLVPSNMLYDLSGPIDAEAQLAVYSAAVDEAIAGGMRGLRVAADITPLVDDPTRRGTHLEWEQYADRYIAGNPLTPMCMYDAGLVRDLAPIASGHPVQGPQKMPFAVYGLGPRRAALAGEVDALNADVLDQVLRAMPTTDELDVSKLGFVDGRGAWVIEQEASRRRQAGQPLMLTKTPAILQQMWLLLGFDQDMLQPA